MSRVAHKEMFDLVGAPAAPTSISLTQLEAEDGELQRLLRETGERRAVQRKLVDEIDGLNRSLATLGAQIDAANSTVDTILTADPVCGELLILA